MPECRRSLSFLSARPVWRAILVFQFTPALINRAMMGLVYGDLFMHLLYRVRPYETEKGAANALYEKWNAIATRNVESGNLITFHKNIRKMVERVRHHAAAGYSKAASRHCR